MNLSNKLQSLSINFNRTMFNREFTKSHAYIEVINEVILRHNGYMEDDLHKELKKLHTLINEHLNNTEVMILPNLISNDDPKKYLQVLDLSDSMIELLRKIDYKITQMGEIKNA